MARKIGLFGIFKSCLETLSLTNSTKYDTIFLANILNAMTGTSTFLTAIRELPAGARQKLTETELALERLGSTGFYPK